MDSTIKDAGNVAAAYLPTVISTLNKLQQQLGGTLMEVSKRLTDAILAGASSSFWGSMIESSMSSVAGSTAFKSAVGIGGFSGKGGSIQELGELMQEENEQITRINAQLPSSAGVVQGQPQAPAAGVQQLQMQPLDQKRLMAEKTDVHAEFGKKQEKVQSEVRHREMEGQALASLARGFTVAQGVAQAQGSREKGKQEVYGGVSNTLNSAKQAGDQTARSALNADLLQYLVTLSRRA